MQTFGISRRLELRLFCFHKTQEDRATADVNISKKYSNERFYPFYIYFIEFKCKTEIFNMRSK